jgi:protein OS-9
MTMTDTILFVKEVKTCSYILVIHTPRLCGEPGFKSRLDARESSTIRCREIVDSNANANPDQQALPEADQPYRLPRRKPMLPPAGAPASQAHGKDPKGENERPSEEALNVMIHRAVKAYMGSKGFNVPEGEQPQVITDRFADEGIILIDIPVDDDMDDGGNGLFDVLRAAGFEIKGEKSSENVGPKGADESLKKAPPEKEDESDDPRLHRTEL